MNWTDQTCSQIQPILNKIKNMPFIQELIDGSLAIEKFQFYIQQDAVYLSEYSRVLAYIGSKSYNNKQALDFFDFAKNAIIVESSLHESYFNKFGLKPNQNINIEPVCHHYVHFLKSTAAFEPIEVAIAAVLPCFWIYKEIGDYIFEIYKKENHPYQEWINTYSSVEFAEATNLAINYAYIMAENSTDLIRSKMFNAFEYSSILEYNFWDAAYNNIRFENNSINSKK